jgi:hypothetical protein
LLMEEWQKAAFFLGIAVYLGVMKWLGWVVLTRRSQHAQRFVLFSAEIFVGLAVALLWFYLRNVVSYVWPACYSLGELALVAPVCVGVHLLAIVVRGKELEASPVRVFPPSPCPLPSQAEREGTRLVPPSPPQAVGKGKKHEACGLALAPFPVGHFHTSPHPHPPPQGRRELKLSAPQGWKEWKRCYYRALWAGFLQRAAIYVPFWFMVTFALWQVSASLNVQATDAVTHAFQARVYVNDGMFLRRFNGNQYIKYPSGLAAINAIAVAVAPLTVVQAVNLQHVVLLVLALFLIPAAISVFAGKPLPFSYSLPLAFFSFFPLYALYPDCFYEGPGRQAAPALLVALCLLPPLTAASTAPRFYMLLGVEAMLALVTLALNPACAPFIALAGLAALLVYWHRGRRFLGLSKIRVTAVLFLLTVGASILVLGCDAYYRGLLTQRAPGTTEASGSQPFFSFASGARWAASIRPLRLYPPARDTGAGVISHFSEWSERAPQRAFPALAVSLGALAGAFWMTARGRNVDRAGLRASMQLILVCLVLWLAVKYGIAFARGSITSSSKPAVMLRDYMSLLSFRCELVLLFTIAMASGASLYLMTLRRLESLGLDCGGALMVLGMESGSDWLSWTDPRIFTYGVLLVIFVALWSLGIGLWLLAERARRPPSVGSLVVAACAFLLYLGPFGLVIVNPSPGGFLVLESHALGDEPVTPEDVRMVSWIDANIPPERGLIGLTGLPFRAGYENREGHLDPFGAAQALLLYSKHYNFCFCQHDPWLADRFGDYTQHVQYSLDTAWCLKNNIRYFYVSAGGMRVNPGLGEAIASGHLRPIRSTSSSSLYEVVP